MGGGLERSGGRERGNSTGLGNLGNPTVDLRRVHVLGRILFKGVLAIPFKRERGGGEKPTSWHSQTDI